MGWERQKQREQYKPRSMNYRASRSSFGKSAKHYKLINLTGSILLYPGNITGKILGKYFQTFA